jgi:hypothetical protein
VLLALTGMESLPVSERPADGPSSEPHDFDDGRGQRGEAPTAELPRATVRIEATTSRWKPVRWSAGVAVAAAVVVAGGWLVDSRQSVIGHRVQHPGTRAGAARSVEIPPVGHARVKRAVSRVVRRNRSTRRFRRAISRKSHLALERRGRSEAAASPSIVSSVESGPPVARRPEARPQNAARDQFSYLGE